MTELLYDGDDNRFIPSHSNKKGRRYRYYVLRTAATDRSSRKVSSINLQAQEIEDFVRAKITSLLRSSQCMMELFTGPSSTSSQLFEANQELKAFLALIDKPGYDLDHLLMFVVARVPIDHSGSVSK